MNRFNQGGAAYIHNGIQRNSLALDYTQQSLGKQSFHLSKETLLVDLQIKPQFSWEQHSLSITYITIPKRFWCASRPVGIYYLKLGQGVVVPCCLHDLWKMWSLARSWLRSSWSEERKDTPNLMSKCWSCTAWLLRKSSVLAAMDDDAHNYACTAPLYQSIEWIVRFFGLQHALWLTMSNSWGKFSISKSLAKVKLASQKVVVTFISAMSIVRSSRHLCSSICTISSSWRYLLQSCSAMFGGASLFVKSERCMSCSAWDGSRVCFKHCPRCKLQWLNQVFGWKAGAVPEKQLNNSVSDIPDLVLLLKP